MSNAARILVRIPLRTDIALDRVRPSVEALGRAMELPVHLVLGRPNSENDCTIEFDAQDHAIELRWEGESDPIADVDRLCVALEPLARAGFHTCWSNLDSGDRNEYDVDRFFGPTEQLCEMHAESRRIELAIRELDLGSPEEVESVRLLLTNRAAFNPLVAVTRHAARQDLAPDVLQKRAVHAMALLAKEPPQEEVVEEEVSAPAP